MKGHRREEREPCNEGSKTHKATHLEAVLTDAHTQQVQSGRNDEKSESETVLRTQACKGTETSTRTYQKPLRNAPLPHLHGR